MALDDDESEQLRNFYEGVATYYFGGLSQELKGTPRTDFDQRAMEKRSGLSTKAIKDNFKTINPKTRKFEEHWRLAADLRNKKVKTHFQMQQILSSTCLAECDLHLAHAHLWGVNFALTRTAELSRLIDFAPASWRIAHGLAIMKIDQLQRSRRQQFTTYQKFRVFRAYDFVFEPLDCPFVPCPNIPEDVGKVPLLESSEKVLDQAHKEFSKTMARSMLLLRVPTTTLPWNYIEDNFDE